MVMGTELKNGDLAPLFTLKTDRGTEFSLETRKGKWTVLYFFPKAGTPGCTQQACAYRDHLKELHQLGAEVFGISTDTAEAQEKFRARKQLNFTLLADPDGSVVNAYGAKLPILTLSKRWTFIVDPKLRIRSVDHDVDPVLDAEKVIERLVSFQK